MATYVSAAYCTKCSKYFKATYDNKTGYRDPEPCPDCGGVAKHKHVIKGSEQDPNISKGRFVGIGYKDNPRWSWAMGINVDEIPEMMRRYPDRNYHPKTGQLEVRNRPHKKKLMKQHNMEEYA